MHESVLLIGCGAISLEVIRRLTGDHQVRIEQVLVRPGKEDAVKGDLEGRVRVISSIDDLDPVPDFVLECASHEAVAEFGAYFLNKGIDFGIISIGALSDSALYEQLEEASQKGNSQLVVIPGAMGGLDALSAGAEGLEEVVYTSKKPPLSWAGTPADEEFDLAGIKEATIIYQGNARQAASLYPKNANVVAAIALAGLGFEKTQVTLFADPGAKGNTHHLQARGTFGELDVTVIGNPLPTNPKTSALAALSAVRALKNRTKHICM
ncbi:MAG: aspartate dehydrogenase [Sneathiella sp.]|nr:aspartate dehydrogenase [Sneathiella sp.]